MDAHSRTSRTLRTLIVIELAYLWELEAIIGAGFKFDIRSLARDVLAFEQELVDTICFVSFAAHEVEGIMQLANRLGNMGIHIQQFRNENGGYNERDVKMAVVDRFDTFDRFMLVTKDPMYAELIDTLLNREKEVAIAGATENLSTALTFGAEDKEIELVNLLDPKNYTVCELRLAHSAK